MFKIENVSNWHTKTLNQVFQKFEVDAESGLNSKGVIRSRAKFGKNTIVQKSGHKLIKIFFKQFYNVMTILLGTAAVVSAVLEAINGSKNYIDSVVIFVIIFINAFLGFFQEIRAEKAISFLKKLSSPNATVFRNGKVLTIPTDEVVIGDILVLNAGSYVPADARLISTNNLTVDESALTGESDEILKDENAVLKERTLVSERKNMVFSTSFVTGGNGRAIVTNIGINTEVGKIAKFINKEKSENTLLQRRLAETSKILGYGVIFISIILITLGIIQRIDFLELFMISISLAVSALPEGLPAVITVILAIGAKRLSDKRAICKNLSAVENLGNVSVICTDKTGTITENKMTVRKIFDFEKERDFNSEFSKKFFTYTSLCNNSKINDLKNKDISGTPTENALAIAALNVGITPKFLREKFKRVREIPFDSRNKTMTTVNFVKNEKNLQKKYLIITKGAAEIVLKNCDFIYKNGEITTISVILKNKIIYNVEKMAESAHRVLAVAYKFSPSERQKFDDKLIFLGLVGIMDKIRSEAKKSVNVAIRAGIKPVIITGDHILTAKAVASEVGILNKKDEILTGEEIDKMNSKNFEKNIYKYSVFARVSAEHKSKIVKAFQKKKAVVAMVGDGVNDVLALKTSDIGCAMGKTGTDVAKSVADVILTDDNFVTIIEAIRCGRGIYINIRKTLHYLISTNIGEILVVLACFLMKLPSPMNAIHLLWLNMVTDSFPAFALGLEPFEAGIMEHKPISPNKKLFSDGLGVSILIEGCFIGSIALLTYTIGRIWFSEIVANTMAFCCLGFSQLLHAFNVRSDESIFRSRPFKNKKLIFSTIFCIILQVLVIVVPVLSEFFKTQNLTPVQWMIVTVMSLSPFIISEIEKFFSS